MQEIMTFVANHPFLNLAAIVVLILIALLELSRAKRNVFNIGPMQVVQLMNHKNAIVIDIRASDLYLQGHIIDAQSIAARDITQNSKKLDKYKNRPIIIVSDIAQESQKIAALLIKQGYNAFSLNGGLRAWDEAQMPLIKE